MRDPVRELHIDLSTKHDGPDLPKPDGCLPAGLADIGSGQSQHLGFRALKHGRRVPLT